jgi:hypothetical protein
MIPPACPFDYRAFPAQCENDAADSLQNSGKRRLTPVRCTDLNPDFLNAGR